MRYSHWLSAGFTALAAVASADDIVYVTDLEIYTMLASCAQYGLWINMDDKTSSSSQCEGETELQSCVCSQTADFNAFSSSMSGSVEYSCGEFATEDQASASSVLDKYCNPDRTITFATPTENVVNAFITELSQTENLAPCAAWALSYAVQDMPSSLCPQDASLYAPCVCSKSYVVERVTSTLSSLASSSCSNGEDATSALNFYWDYCAMNNGTTSFDEPDTPPGDMTYYITDLPEYSSLNECAQSAVSEVVLTRTYDFCPPGGGNPQALASCVCIKSGMSRYVSSLMTNSVKYTCDSTATADVNSAISLLQYYCSAAEDLVIANVQVESTGSITSDATTRPTSSEPRSTSVRETQSVGGESGDGEGAGDGGESSDDEGSGVSRVGAIAGGVVGGVVALISIALIAFYVRRKRQKQEKGEQLHAADNNGNNYAGKPELAGPETVVLRPGTGHVNPNSIKPELPTAVSHGEMPTPTTPSRSPQPQWPLAAPPVPGLTPSQSATPELQGTISSGYAMPYGEPPQELAAPGHTSQPQQLHGQSVSPLTPMSPGQQSWQQQQSPQQYQPSYPSGMSWQSGPVQSYEMESNPGRRD